MSDLSSAGGEKVSEVGTTMGTETNEDELDKLISRGSAPNLASLFRKGKEKGLIQPQQEYGHTT